ncbi:MAG: zf-HC2 domain-containing protein [Acidobacteria bacterium]|nr:zf-HC2 domain-containing protein [Acidobacteriota bacterium]
MAHIEERQVAAYWSGTLPPQELLRLDDHVAACESCRSLLSDGKPHRPPIAPFEDHLSYEDLRDSLTAAPSDSIRTHLANCETCRKEFEDLRAFQRELQTRHPTSAWWKSAAIAAGLLLAAWGIVRLTQHPAPTLAAAIQDNGRTLGIDPSGNLVGFAGTPDSAAQIKALLQDGTLAIAPLPDGVRTPATTFLGPEKATPAFVPTAPLARIVLSDRPAFSWTPLDGAQSYRVQVMDDQFQPLADSGEQQTTTWRPAAPLPREKVLIWQISARQNGKLLRTPQPPLPEARFYIASQAAADRIAAASSRQPVSHLELAVLYANAGLKEEAQQELRALATTNPGSSLVQRWQQSLRGESR